jgi:hypothetical protein
MYARWNTILDYWQGPQGRHALTFSFLIGALNRDGISDARVEIEKLIKEICSCKINDSHFFVYRCPDINILVIRAVAAATASRKDINLTGPNGDKSSLYLSADDFDKQASSEELVDVVLRESGEAIMNGNFTRNGQRFMPFTPYDERAIQNALA